MVTGEHMPDETKHPEQAEKSAKADQSADKVTDLPNKPLTDRDAQSVKGGLSGQKLMDKV